jgi:hypothetical protein
MKSSGEFLGCALGGILLATQAMAANGHRVGIPRINAGDNPYKVIVDRNVFDLKDPPPPPPPDPTNAPPPNVELTGIMSVLGEKQALFMVQDAPSPGKQPKLAESFILTVGQREGPLEVLAIDEKSKKVKIKNDGIVSTITFETKTKTSGPMRGQPANAASFGKPPNPFAGRRPWPGQNSNPFQPQLPLQSGRRFQRPG